VIEMNRRSTCFTEGEGLIAATAPHTTPLARRRRRPMSGILSRIKSALGKIHAPKFLTAHHFSSTYANGAPGGNPPTPAPEGTVPFTVDGETHQTWYRICGDLASTSVPLVVIHGGGYDLCRPGWSPGDLVMLTSGILLGLYFQS